ncbi:MAG TPA: glycine betaine ABC transporter substrate-binding protein [Burkholderiales bacterium]|nr:glycine betaine ABC transporter substrate-binding protein [Burkholderiales bacterium]
MRAAALAATAAVLAAAAVPAGPAAAEHVVVGSKRFTESYILGEILREAAARAGTQAEYKPGLGNTGIVFAALKSGAIDVYPEYTGTIAREILNLDGNLTLREVDRQLAPMGFGAGVPLGFNNTYALAMRDEQASRLGIRTLSDLARHPGLKLGLSQEFIGRGDGWPGLKRAYGLPYETPSGLDHGLAYEAIAAGRIDVMDIYSTDAKIERYALRVLTDDRGYFPKYDAVLLYRRDLPQRAPRAWQGLAALEGKIDERRMIRLNAAAELEGRTFQQAAASFFDAGAGTGTRADTGAAAPKRGYLAALLGPDLGQLTYQHLLLVIVSLALAIVIGVPLGVLAFKVRGAGQPILAAVGVIQTVPALALLAFLIAGLGRIGTLPALVALFLYALLPIVRNTHAGLAGIRPGMREAALALGLSARDRLFSIELPLAAPTILAGVKTSAVINVGTATIAAFIGAGGYGERIVQGLALNDNALLVAGAVPAAVLALLVQGAFELAEWHWRIPGAGR